MNGFKRLALIRRIVRPIPTISMASILCLAACGGDSFPAATTTQDGGDRDSSSGHSDASVDSSADSTASDGALSDVRPDQSNDGSVVSDGSPPIDSSTPDAKPTDSSVPDVVIDAPLPTTCSGTAFSTEPAYASASGFRMKFHDTAGLACIKFDIMCSNGTPAIESLIISSKGQEGCLYDHCWSVLVTNCKAGAASVRFLYNVPGGGDCAQFHGSGELAGSCLFEVSK